MAEHAGRDERPASPGAPDSQSLKHSVDQNMRGDEYVGHIKLKTGRAQSRSCIAGTASAADPKEQIASLFTQIQELSSILNLGRDEMDALSALEISTHHIASASLELYAITAHTVAATNEILDACETIDPIAKQLDPDGAAQILAGTMRIYTACSFQDLVGQRIRKIYRTFLCIEAKVDHIIQMFGDASPTRSFCLQQGHESNKCLLNGPQLPHAAMDQSEIDRLLAGG